MLTLPYQLALDLAACLRFWSRLPVPGLPGEPEAHAMPDFGIATRMLPLAGFVIALPAALVLAFGLTLALPPIVVGALAIATLALTTGGLHEDGLADTVDGLGGGASPARRLEIMKDSCIGSYGGLALIVSVLVRVGALSAIAEQSLWLAVTALVASAAVSRATGLLPLLLLPPARLDGAGRAAAAPQGDALWAMAGSAALIALLPMFAGASLGRVIVALIAAVFAAWLLVPLARKMIGGQTGDIAGAAQQMAEMAMLIVFSSAL